MFARHEQEIKNNIFVWTDMVVPVDIAFVVASWCIPVEVYRTKKQTGMPSYRLRDEWDQRNEGEDGKEYLVCPIIL